MEKRVREEKKKERNGGELSAGHRGSVSPADIVSMLLTSKASDYEESEGLQTMAGEENNIKVSRAFELRSSQNSCSDCMLHRIRCPFFFFLPPRKPHSVTSCPDLAPSVAPLYS